MKRICVCALTALAALGCGASPRRTQTTTPAHRTPPEVTRARQTTVIVPNALAAAARESGARAQIVVAANESSAHADAQASLERARVLYLDLRFDDALAAIGDAQSVLEASARGTEDFDLLHLAWVYRAMNELALGHRDRASQVLDRAARMRPQATLDETRVPPDVRELYAGVQGAVRAEPPASLAITTVPDGAWIRLDGERAGHAPTTLRGQAGRHIVRVEALGYAPRMLLVDLRASGGEPAHVALDELGPDQSGQLAADLGVLDRAELGELARSRHARARVRTRLGARRVVLVAPERAGLGALAIDLVTGEAREAHAQGDADAVAIRALLSRVGVTSGEIDVRPSGALAASAQPGGREDDEEESGSVLKSPWFWVAATVATVGLVAIVAVAASNDTTRIVLTPSP